MAALIACSGVIYFHRTHASLIPSAIIQSNKINGTKIRIPINAKFISYNPSILTVLIDIPIDDYLSYLLALSTYQQKVLLPN